MDRFRALHFFMVLNEFVDHFFVGLSLKVKQIFDLVNFLNRAFSEHFTFVIFFSHYVNAVTFIQLFGQCLDGFFSFYRVFPRSEFFRI